MHHARTLRLNEEIHSSHDMEDWRDTIVTIISTPRFGRIRSCKNCGAEQAETAAGADMFDELRYPCG